MSAAEYKSKFPGSVLRIQTEESRLKIAKSKKDGSAKGPWNKGIKTGTNEKLSFAKKDKPNLKSRGQTRTVAQRLTISNATKAAMQNVDMIKVGEKLSAAIQKRKENGSYIPPMLGKTHSDATKEKIKASSKSFNETKNEKLINECIRLANEDGLIVKTIDDQYWFNFQCIKCELNFTFTRQVFRDSTLGGQKLCPTCHPRMSGRSKLEAEFFNAIRLFQPDAIPNDRRVLCGKEIDVFVPSKKIGFEFTGLYWHSQIRNPVKHHLLWKQQHAFNNGVQLYTVFEDEWINNRELVLSRIRAILGTQTNVVYARKCEVREVSSQHKNEFLISNHIQGKDASSIKLGLYYHNKLVSLATFKKTNMVKGGDGSEWELSRFCSSKNMRVVGGASRLIKHFMTRFNTEGLNLISFADRRWSTGKLYESIGFNFVATSPPSYWYLDNNYTKRVHRSKFMKHKLVENAEDANFTEWELAQKKGLDRIWDCGTTKWILYAPEASSEVPRGAQR